MLYDIIQKRRGKEKIVKTDELSKCRNFISRMPKIIGRRRDRIEYRLEKSNSNIKMKYKSVGYNDGKSNYPEVIK